VARFPLVGAVTAVLVAGGLALGPHVGNLHNGLIAVSFTAVGLYVVRRRPGHREGWLFVAVGVAHAVMFAGRQYGLHAGPLPGASWIGWLGIWPLPLVLVLVGVAVMCFPSGRLPSRAWVPVVGVLITVGIVLASVSALWPVEYARTGLLAGHPFDLPGRTAAEGFYGVARPVGYLLFQLTWVACVVVRVWRARGDEARQLRWFLYAATVSAVVMVLGLAVWGSPVPGTLTVPLLAVAAGAAILRYRLYDIDPVINKSLVLGAMAALVTVGYAVVVIGVGRLVDGYGTLLSLLAIGLVAVAFEPLRRRAQRLADRLVYGRRATPYEALARLSAHFTAPAGGLLDNICATVADAVGAREVTLWTGPAGDLRAVSVWPARQPLPSGPRTLADLATANGKPGASEDQAAGSLGQGVRPEPTAGSPGQEVRPDPMANGKSRLNAWPDAAASGKQGSGARSDAAANGKQGSGTRPDAAASGKQGPAARPDAAANGKQGPGALPDPPASGKRRPSERPDAAERNGDPTSAAVTVLPVRHDGRFRGAITVAGGALSGAEQRLAGDLAAQAGLVLELRATAQRLVAAGDAARRRLERDLHDGAQQRLVTVAMELGAVVRLATTAGAVEVAARADDVRRQLLEATAELREMARGLHPAVLTQDGLEAAIGFLADRSPLPVRLTVSVGRRLPAEVESTAYFVVSEGLTNAARHSGADAVAVRLVLDGAGLEAEVSDDGCGGAAVRAGSGLEGLADRLATLDARLTVESGPAGTRVGTVIPCA
jgi:signal transduction histidine kinase